MRKLVTMVASVALAVGCMLPQQLHAEESTEATVSTKVELQEAIQNVNISTIRLGDNISADVVIPENRTVTLDLGGKTLTNENNHTIKNMGNLVVTGDGIVDNISNGKAAVSNTGTIVLNGGTYKRSQESGVSDNSVNSGNGNSWYTLNNQGSMEINNAVTVELAGTFSSLIENGYYSGATTDSAVANLTINGGTFTGGKYTVKNDEMGKTNILGGTFKNTCPVGAAILNYHYMDISAGTFTASKYALYGESYGATGAGVLNVSGGNFTADKPILSKTNAKVSLSGGQYSSEPGDFVVEGFKAFNLNGSYVIAPLASKVTLSNTELTVEEGQSKTLVASLTPTDTLETVSWTSSDEKIATVKDGKVTAVAAGIATITAKTESGIEAECKVTVTKPVKVEELPSIDTSKPVEEVTVGISDEKAGEILKNVADQIVSGTKNFASTETIKAVADAVNNGESITVSTEVKEADTNKAEIKADAEKIQKELKTLVSEDKASASVAMYLDINVLIKTDTQVLGNVTKLPQEVTFMIAIPEKLQAEGREFKVMRVHNGEVTMLDTTMNKDGSALTFDTNLFSTYALVYVDKKAEEPTPTPDPKPEPTPNPDPTPNPQPTPEPETTVYNVVFVDMNGAVLKVEKVNANGAATAPVAPAVEGYRFVKWDTDFSKVTKDLLVKPVYEKVTATEKPTATPEKPSSDKNTPDTGDTTSAGLFTAFALLGLVSMGIIAVQRKRKQLMK